MNAIIEKTYHVVQDDYVHAGEAASTIKQTLATLGVNPSILRRIAVASYEAEINMIIHAFGGNIILTVYEDGTIQIVFHDDGPGIDDIEQALTPGFSTASEKARQLGFGAGMGLPNIKRVSDTFDLQSSKEGTILTLAFKVME